MRRHTFSIILTIILSLLLASNLPAKQRGIKVTVRTPEGKEIPLYKNSYAFVVGNGTYTKGWDPLPGAIRDVKDVARALEENGFNVVLKTDLTRNEFNRAFGSFCYKYGRDKANRLLFYYAGHGHTQKMFTGEDLGYLVMVDAPVPEKDPIGFRLSSVDMQAIVTEAKMIQARHVLFMFDSCFSGSILNLRERVVPEIISDSVSLPVRQFITAGRANEPVPDHSIFKQAFLDLLEGRDKEPIPDGYITGEELGLYLKNKVPEYNPTQHPQYGKIKDIRLDKGDFVFALKIPSTPQPPAVGQSSSIRDYDKIIEERKANKKKWDSWQRRMETDLSKVERYDKSSALNAEEKAEAWEGLLASYSADNPYTVKDNDFRKKAVERNQYWKGHKESGKIFVETVPSNAAVRILNIGPKFHQGIELAPGRYHVEVSASGYKTKERWVELSAGEDENISIRLETAVIDDPGVRLLEFSSVAGSFVDSEKGVRLFVIRGRVGSKYPKPRSYILLKANLLDYKERVAKSEQSYAGNTFSKEELKTLSLEEIKKAMNNRDGMARKNVNLSPRVNIPFMIVFDNLPDNLSEFTVEAVSSSPRASSSTSNVIKRDGIYVAYANGIVKDTKTGLEWKVGPDKETTWDEARSWVQSLNLDGGGWRMPTMDELEGLYKDGAGKRNMTPLLKTTGWWVWSGEAKGSSDAGYFGFFYGFRGWGGRSDAYYGRAFAVRSRSDG